MDNYIELNVLSVDYSKIQKYVNKIENYELKLSNNHCDKNTIKSKIEKETNNLSFQIENSPEVKRKFRLAITMGSLISPSASFGKDEIIYDSNGFSTHPNTTSYINNDNFIANIYESASFILIDESGNILKPKKYFNNLAICLTSNNCLFISNNQIEMLKTKVLHLINNFFNNNSKISNGDKIKFSIYKEKLTSLFENLYCLSGYDLKEYYFNELNIPNFNELVSKIVIKLFNGERLQEFEKIIIARLTNIQIIEMLNCYIQHNYKNSKLNNYLSNINDINNIIGSSSFKQYVNLGFNYQITNNNSTSDNQDNVIEVDFVNKKIKK